MPPSPLEGEPTLEPAHKPPESQHRPEILGPPVPGARSLFAGMLGTVGSLQSKPAPVSADPVWHLVLAKVLCGRSNRPGIPALPRPFRNLQGNSQNAVVRQGGVA